MKYYKLYLVEFIVFLFVLFLVWQYVDFVQEKTQEKKNANYKLQAKEMRKKVSEIILVTQKSTMTMALSIANDKGLALDIIDKKIASHYYIDLISKYKKYTRYKNVWIHVIDVNLNSLYKSWSDEYGEKIDLIRNDLRTNIGTKKIKYYLNVGKYDLGIKATVPIIHSEKVVGFLEVISHFNSVSKQIKRFDVDSVVVVKKEYKKRLKYPATNIFIGEYYVANLDAQPIFREHLEKYGIENYFNNSYHIEDGYIVTSHELKNMDEKIIGYYIMFKKIDDTLDIQEEFFMFKWLSIGLFVIMTIAVTGTAILYYINIRQKKELEYLSITDALTGIGNRRFYHQKLESEIKRVKRYNHPLSLIMFDIDFFKQVNDKYGHSVGDEVLIEYSKLVHSLLREGDSFCRIGGEEFMIIIPHATGNEAKKIAEKLRIAVESYKKVVPITISFGVVEYVENENMDSIYKRVDAALYKAKENGRNMVVLG